MENLEKEHFEIQVAKVQCPVPDCPEPLAFLSEYEHHAEVHHGINISTHCSFCQGNYWWPEGEKCMNYGHINPCIEKFKQSFRYICKRSDSMECEKISIRKLHTALCDGYEKLEEAERSLSLYRTMQEDLVGLKTRENKRIKGENNRLREENNRLWTENERLMDKIRNLVEDKRIVAKKAVNENKSKILQSMIELDISQEI